MIAFSRSLVFRHTLIYVGLFTLSQIVIFGVLYWSTLRIYEARTNAVIEAEAQDLRLEFAGLSVTEMAAIVTRRCEDEPGEFDEYILATRNYEYIAGNIRVWPTGARQDSALIDLALGDGSDGYGESAIHRVLTLTLPSGDHLLVGHNLTEFEKIRNLIGRALIHTLALTLLLGFGGGYLFSRALARRLDKINSSSLAILEGDISRRMPLTGSGDEFDVLSRNLNRMLDRIEELMTSMREVTDNVAHDLRKPLSRLHNRIEVTLLGSRDPDAYRETLEHAVREMENIETVFSGLLTISMAESGASRDRFERIDLAEIVRSAVEIYGPAAEDSGLALDVREDTPTPITGDPHLIAQAVANLIDNAIKHAPGTGPVVLRTVRRQDHAELTVADRGPGIPEEFRERAMERFSRLEQSRTTPGSGLGLSLVRAVALLHGGAVALEDNRPGLKVTLRFPVGSNRSSA